MEDQKKRKRRGEREDGRVLVTLSIGKDKHGKTVRMYFYGKTRKEAEGKRDQYKKDLEQGILSRSDSLTLGDWIDEWYARYKATIKTSNAKNYKSLIKRLKQSLGVRLIKTIVEADLQSEIYSVADLSQSTIDKYYSLIRQVFSKAKRNRNIAYDPSEDLLLPKGYEGSHRALERWETDCIIENWNQHRAGLWAMLMLLCGLRRGEMMALRWENIDMVNRNLSVCEVAVIDSNRPSIEDRAKSPAGIRTIPICEPLWNALNSIPESSRYGFVCLSAKNEPLTGSAFTRGWNSFNFTMERILNGEPLTQQGRRTDIEKKNLQANESSSSDSSRKSFSVLAHDLRHTFATALYDAGISVKAAQYYLGHADSKITFDLYTHLSREREKKERIALTSFLDEWIGEKAKGKNEPFFNLDDQKNASQE